MSMTNQVMVLAYEWGGGLTQYVVCTPNGKREFENEFITDGDYKPILIPDGLQTPAVKERVARMSRWPVVNGRVTREYNFIGSIQH